MYLRSAEKYAFHTHGREPSRSTERGRFTPRGFVFSPVCPKTPYFGSFWRFLKKSVFGIQGWQPSRSTERDRFPPRGFVFSPVCPKTPYFGSFWRFLTNSFFQTQSWWPCWRLIWLAFRVDWFSNLLLVSAEPGVLVGHPLLSTKPNLL